MSEKAQKRSFATRTLIRLKNLGSWCRSHIILSVLGFLGVSWIGVSTLVYWAERSQSQANITSYGQALWWGLATFLTVGYGDYTPVSWLGRVWAGLLMFSGVFGVAIITSKISSYFMEEALREGRGIVNSSRLKDHFIVCGWKEDMHELLIHILDFNRTMTAEDLVLVANLGLPAMDNLHQHPRLTKLQIVVGNYFDAVTLKRAAPERARKVLILADRTPTPTGATPAMTEVDARTIMTAMMLSNIARGTPVTAEIIDPKMDQYLKLASVSEVIYSREYSRLLLGNASAGTGMSNIIFDLLDPKTPTRITSALIPEEFFHLKYFEFKSRFQELHPHGIILGILENTGNSHSIKEMALRQAQKTPDVSRLVQNLRNVKELKCNHPVFSPPSDYVVPEGSMAILIETRDHTNPVSEGGTPDAIPRRKENAGRAAA